MRVLRTVGLLALAALLVYAMPAAAQQKMAGSLYAGYAKMIETGAPGGSIGGRINGFYMVTPMIGVGVEAGYHMLGKFEESDVIDGVPVTVELKFTALQATAQLLARGGSGSARPYGTIGGGLYQFKAKATGSVAGTEVASLSYTETKPGFNGGGGVQFKPASSQIGFGVDVRGHYILTSDSATKMITAMAGVNFN